VPAADIEAMRRTRPPRREFPTLASTELDFARELMQIANARSLQIESAELSVALAR
jgi:hypothetical protein